MTSLRDFMGQVNEEGKNDGLVSSYDEDQIRIKAGKVDLSQVEDTELLKRYQAIVQ